MDKQKAKRVVDRAFDDFKHLLKNNSLSFMNIKYIDIVDEMKNIRTMLNSLNLSDSMILDIIARRTTMLPIVSCKHLPTEETRKYVPFMYQFDQNTHSHLQNLFFYTKQACHHSSKKILFMRDHKDAMFKEDGKGLGFHRIAVSKDGEFWVKELLELIKPDKDIYQMLIDFDFREKIRRSFSDVVNL